MGQWEATSHDFPVRSAVASDLVVDAHRWLVLRMLLDNKLVKRWECWDTWSAWSASNLYPHWSVRNLHATLDAYRSLYNLWSLCFWHSRWWDRWARLRSQSHSTNIINDDCSAGNARSEWTNVHHVVSLMGHAVAFAAVVWVSKEAMGLAVGVLALHSTWYRWEVIACLLIAVGVFIHKKYQF